MTGEEQLLQYLCSINGRPEDWPAYELYLRAILKDEIPPVIMGDSFLLASLLQAVQQVPGELNLLIVKILEKWPMSVYFTDQVCHHWLRKRNPLLENLIARHGWRMNQRCVEQNVLLRLKFEPAERFDCKVLNKAEYNSNQDSLARGLIRGLDDADQTIRDNARHIILHLDTEGVRRIAWTWNWHLSESLSVPKLLAQVTHIPTVPVETAMLAHLFAGNVGLVAEGEPDIVPALLRATTEDEPELNETARRVILNLKTTATRDELIKQIIRQDLPKTQATILEAGWLPTDPAERAMFYFVTRQWDNYENLDWDRRILRLYYETGSAPFRQRLAALIREAGRVNYLTALIGGLERQRADELTADETELEIQILARNEAWPALWSLVGKLPLIHSLQSLRVLQAAGWTPPNLEEAGLMTQLGEYAARLRYDRESQVSEKLTLSAPQAQFKLAGRINALAFDPTGPRLAIATGKKKVVVWDYQQGRATEKINLPRAAGVVTYLPNGVLAIGEKTNTTAVPCQIYLWQKGQLHLVGRHLGSVTGLVGTNDRLYSTGRDFQLCLWDTAAFTTKALVSQSLKDWGRKLYLSPDNKYLGLMAEAAYLLPLLPDGGFVPGPAWKSPHSNGLTFTANPQNVMLAEKYGTLRLTKIEALKTTDDPYYTSPGRAEQETSFYNIKWQNLHHLARLGLLAGVGLLRQYRTPMNQGRVVFLDHHSLNTAATLEFNEPDLKLTDATFTANGQIMALGHCDQQFSLWDLRPLVLQRAFSLPLSALGPAELSALLAFEPAAEDLRPSLDYIKAILQFRYRHDIELAEPDVGIAPGQFDIEVE